MEGKENGTYVGPTVIDYVTPNMSVAKEEIFGPVISIMRTKTVDEALAIENANPYGNAASVFTQNGGMARYIIDRASAGMIGVNLGQNVRRCVKQHPVDTIRAHRNRRLRACHRSHTAVTHPRTIATIAIPLWETATSGRT